MCKIYKHEMSALGMLQLRPHTLQFFVVHVVKTSVSPRSAKRIWESQGQVKSTVPYEVLYTDPLTGNLCP